MSVPEEAARLSPPSSCFKLNNPTIVGNNAAQFTVSDITTNAQLWYTTDGSDPTNAAPSQLAGTITGTNSFGTNIITLSLPFPDNTNVMTFKIRGFRDGYSPSGNAVQAFYLTNFVANPISFGFHDPARRGFQCFCGIARQIFYAPVTMSVLSGTTIYSLQFNVTVANTNVISPAQVASASIAFQSMLMQPIPPPTNFPPGLALYTPIPPYMFIANASSPPAPGQIVSYNNGSFINLEFVTNNLLGVGWLERYTQTNLYNTLSQDLIQYSMAHDDLFNQGNGDVIVGGYAFQVPANAGPNDAYQIQIGRPSATDDGVGAPGSSVFIATPSNGSLGSGAINSIKIVTLGIRKYIAGNSYPFHWFNAGDFGNTNLQNADAEQVLQSAIYSFNDPPAGSDFFDAMDSCGNQLAYYDGDTGFYTNSPAAASLDALFNGNDSTINNMAYGNGQLDVCDVYVTFRRSLDTNNLVWFQRFWTNGVRVATANYAPVIQSSASGSSGGKVLPALSSNNSTPASVTNNPSVNFAATDLVVTAGQTDFNSRHCLGLRPISPARDDAEHQRRAAGRFAGPDNTHFILVRRGVGAAHFRIRGFPGRSTGNGNYAAAWLNSAIAGISNNAIIGTLTVTIPTNATSLSAYAVHFDHASGSPNGIASFPKQALTGLITLSSRNTSSYNDGIPDSWRLRWFGTIYNLLSVSNACPSGDGVNNWKKYVAGVDPNTPNDFPSLNPNTPPPSGTAMSIYWPTVSGKQYAILSSASLFPGNWNTNAIITGNGNEMEFDDSTAGSAKFYRVLILP